MATKTLIQYVDDLTGEELPKDKAETVPFALDGVDYEIDLSSKNAKELRKVMQKYVDAGHRIGRKTGKRGAKTSGPTAQELRLWAEQNGIEVPPRGRIPQSVHDAYNAK